MPCFGNAAGSSFFKNLRPTLAFIPRHTSFPISQGTLDKVSTSICQRSELNKKKDIDPKALVLFSSDSTIISLTSKLLWKEGYHLLGETPADETSARFHPQVKLFSGINSLMAEPGGTLINFGQGHDSKYGEETIAATPKNGVNN